MNPTVTVTTNFVGEKRVNWGWSGVGGCFSPFGCNGPRALTLSVEEIDGTIPAWDPYARPFLATLTPDERAAIVRYDAFNDPPSRDPATFATDPRFQLLGPASLSLGAASYPTAAWMPCTGSLTEASFAPLAETEVFFPGSSRTLAVQHGILSHQATCVLQQPGLTMGTTTPDCEITSLVYVDKIFGTLLFAPVTATPSCTTP